MKHLMLLFSLFATLSGCAGNWRDSGADASAGASASGDGSSLAFREGVPLTAGLADHPRHNRD